jgi:hypothetical protein
MHGLVFKKACYERLPFISLLIVGWHNYPKCFVDIIGVLGKLSEFTFGHKLIRWEEYYGFRVVLVDI